MVVCRSVATVTIEFKSPIQIGFVSQEDVCNTFFTSLLSDKILVYRQQ